MEQGFLLFSSKHEKQRAACKGSKTGAGDSETVILHSENLQVAQTIKQWGLLAFSPDGAELAVGGQSGLTASICTVSYGKLIQPLRHLLPDGSRSEVFRLYYRNDGKELIAAASRTPSMPVGSPLDPMNVEKPD